MAQAVTTLVGLGIPDMPLARLPGHLGVQSRAEMREHVLNETLDLIVTSLTRHINASEAVKEPELKEIVFKGSFSDVNAHFYDKEWSDGLPFVPPTISKIEEFLRFTDRSPDEELGIVLPDNRAASIWTVAANGVMAGCRPEYMPILIAATEAMCDPGYGVESSGNTPGADTLIMLNGPIAKELGFNFEQGVLRDGFQANTSIGRFFRLILRNVCGFLPHKTDKGCYGNTWRVVMPENMEVLNKLGWDPINVEMGGERGENAVTLSRFTSGDVAISVTGDTPELMMPYLADAMVRVTSWQLTFVIGAMSRGMLRPLLIITPVLAETFAKAGWDKNRIKQALFEMARIPAWKFENLVRVWTETTKLDLRELVRTGEAPEIYYESRDPERMLPIVLSPDHFMVAVAGDPLRTNAYVFQHNGTLGFPTCKKIDLPTDWDAKLSKSQSGKQRK